MPLTIHKAECMQLPDGSHDFHKFKAGSGGEGCVYIVHLRTLDTGTITVAALKEIFMKYGSEEEISEKLRREADVASQFSHPNVVRCLGICYELPFRGLLFEYCSNDFSILCNHSNGTGRRIPMRVLVNWAKQIAKGMECISKKGFVHRDVKPTNVLVEQNPCTCFTFLSDVCPDCGGHPLDQLRLVICDLGSTKFNNKVKNTNCGTMAYYSPESYQHKFSVQSDVWSFGVVMWEMTSGEKPFRTPDQLGHGIPLPKRDSWPKKWKEIMNDCWARDTCRPTFCQLVQALDDYEEHIEEEEYQYAEPDENESTPLMGENKERENVEDTTIVRRNKERRKVVRNVCIAINIFLSIITVLLFSSIFFIFLSGKDKPPCDSGWTFLKSTKSCYKMIKMPLTFQVAEDRCVSEHSNLASIHSPEEHIFLSGLYHSSMKQSEKQSVWLGLQYHNGEGRWTDKSLLDYGGSENKPIGNQSFAYMEPFQFNWKTIDNGHRESICKKPARKTSYKTPNTPCQKNHTYFSNTHQCYHEFPGIKFNETALSCKTSVHSESENIFLVGMAIKGSVIEKKYPVWLGLTEHQGRQVWSDGSRVGYENWRDGQRLTMSGESAVIDIVGGKWKQFNGKGVAICKTKLDL